MRILKYIFSFDSFMFKNNLTLTFFFSFITLINVYINLFYYYLKYFKKIYKSYKLATFKELIFINILT